MSTDAGMFADWLSEVRQALDSINMPMDTWQAVWPFDFAREFADGTAPSAAALKANRFWWWKQNQRLDHRWPIRWTGGSLPPTEDSSNPSGVTGSGNESNPPTTITDAESFAHCLLHNAVAISALIHGSSDYSAFYMRVGRTVAGFPGIWSLCIEAAEEFTKQELRISAEGEANDTYSFEWLDAIDKYADAILKIEANQLDRSNLERLAHRAVWGDVGNQCPLHCPACQPIE
jgi:hypothetical protein